MELPGLNDQFFRSSMDEMDDLLLQIFMLLKPESNNNYFVGGCVRDKLLSQKPKDFDIVTDIPIKKSRKIFEKAGWNVSTSGQAFLVLNVSKKGYQFEIATFRKEGCYDGRRPRYVAVGTMQEDAERRDFTINALYQDPWTGKILDPTEQGRIDLANRVLRFIGSPKERIEEDRLRVFRFYRFLTKGFKPDKKSLQACRTMFKESYNLTKPERVMAELEKIGGLK
jgi:tRNA nucleotidyltransferase/poly(A) polymerase